MSRWKKTRDYFLPAASADSKGFSQVPPPVSFFFLPKPTVFHFGTSRLELKTPVPLNGSF